jgi:hypothetical protein
LTGRGILKYHHEGRVIDYVPKLPDLHEAEMTLVREIQAKHFLEEMNLLLRLCVRDPDAQPELRRRNSTLLTIDPFVDVQEIVCAGGAWNFWRSVHLIPNI